jgi:hypothetical protein
LAAGIASGTGVRAQRSLGVASAATIVKGGAVKAALMPHVVSATKLSALSLGKAAHAQQTSSNGAMQLSTLAPVIGSLRAMDSIRSRIAVGR